ncbi:hypothetical protein [Streptomyces sp. NPDC056105]|uniref:hypothetical protein n=1 Tax=Streptomyces sp. NPDC056105 TaxID=3345714 RepID=UPI0035D72D7E
MLERIAARRGELDTLVEQLTKQLEEARPERDELAVAERVTAETPAAVSVQAGGRGVLLVPHRERGLDEAALPAEYRQIFAVVRAADGPVMAKEVRAALKLGDTPRGEPMRGKLGRLAQRGWLRKTAGGRFTGTL